MKPLFQPISYRDPFEIFLSLQHLPYASLFESVTKTDTRGRFSFIAVDPDEVFQIHYPGRLDQFRTLNQKLHQFPLDHVPELPPFQGGLAGMFSYDLGQLFEKLPVPSRDIEKFPLLDVGLYDVVMSFDHRQEKAWIISTGYPEFDLNKRAEKQSVRLQFFRGLITKTHNFKPSQAMIDECDLNSSFSRSGYIKSVEQVKQYILEGDIFEANISQRFSTKMPSFLDSIQLYERLRRINPAPFSAYLNFGSYQILSGSPERFIKLHRGKLETRPIKGTAPRGESADSDVQQANALKNSNKDRAENIMIVDLMRNDFSKVSEANSVEVTQLCGLETYAKVHHLVSAITGKLKNEYDAFDVISAAFPGGSITGAPKIRAMEIIAEIEPHARGPYCGSLGYISFNGDMDLSITIRTFLLKDNTLSFQVGGAVVLDSDPEAEYIETLTKADALKRCLINLPPLKKEVTLAKRMPEVFNTNPVLIIDNFDSFVYNLARYVKELGFNPEVYRNDKITLQEIAEKNPSHIIISPGPCRPNSAGITLDLIRTFASAIPILGVCLGHQAIGQAFGGQIIHALMPMHGKSSLIQHTQTGLFEGIPSPLKVGRYHSLVVSPQHLPESLEITAFSDEREIMGLKHKHFPCYGIQFHPESILTDFGYRLLENFFRGCP